MEKSCRNYAPEGSSRTLLNFGKYPKTAIHYMQEIVLKIRYLERGFSKSLKKNKWIQSLLMNKIMKNKRSLKLVTSHSSGYKTSLDKFLD